ncbi:hypothetical protein K492DRAFT_14125 [Lichtheimia hyalospora FSU 10163]|nr:hypothetical protein K492DRAFT_14125 [Lichtheimia hyalospora FSU 10163]
MVIHVLGVFHLGGIVQWHALAPVRGITLGTMLWYAMTLSHHTPPPANALLVAAGDPSLSKGKRLCVSPIHSFGGFIRQPRCISPGQTSDLVSASYKPPPRGRL